MAEKKEAKTFYLGTGRRKSSVARVRVTEGKGLISINGRALDNYFTEDKDRAAVMGPLAVTEQANRVDVIVKVHGGGITGQAGAISQGVARALKTMFSPADQRKAFTLGTTTSVQVARQGRDRHRLRGCHSDGRERKPDRRSGSNRDDSQAPRQWLPHPR